MRVFGVFVETDSKNRILSVSIPMGWIDSQPDVPKPVDYSK